MRDISDTSDKNIIDDKVSKKIQENLKEAFDTINEEFSDHLQAINENTNEIQGNYEYICELDSKIDKLGEKMDEIVMLLRRSNIDMVDERVPFDIRPLNTKEKEIFFALYSLEEELNAVTYQDISRKLSLPASLVQAYITNLFGKGVPILKRYRESKVYLTLDPEFRVCQARENLIGITETIARRINQ